MAGVARATAATHEGVEYRRHSPDLAWMDSRLPAASGTDALIAIGSEFPEGPHPDADYIGRSRETMRQPRSRIYLAIAGILVFGERKADPGLPMRLTFFPYASEAL